MEEILQLANFLNRLIGSSLVVFCLGVCPLSAEEDQSPPTEVSLKYSETRQAEQPQCKSGGGFLGVLDCVAVRIEGAGASGNITSTAALALTLVPILRAEGNRREVKVYVRMDGGRPSISRNFENQQQVEDEVNGDARRVRERLKRWSTQLRAGQLDDLKTKGETQVTIPSSFWSVLKRLELENPPVTMTVRLPPFEVNMKFLVKDGASYSPVPASGVGYGEVFVVEVTFTQPQSEPTFYVDLNWTGTSRPYETRVERADNTGKLYRSPELRAGYLYGPRVEAAVDPGGP